VELLSIPRLLITGNKTSVGKTILGTGLIHELRRRGISTSCCVSGPNLLQALLYKRVSGRYARTLDDRLLDHEALKLTAYFGGVGANLLLIFGGAGLLERNMPGGLRGSDAELAETLRAPVLLVVDGRDFETRYAAEIRELLDSASSLHFVGSVFNRLSRDRLDDKEYITSALLAEGLAEPLGFMPEVNFDVELPDRIPSQKVSRTSLPMQFFLEVASTVSKHVNIDELVAGAQNVESVRLNFDYEPAPRRTRIAVTDDNCFNLCFQDNLDLLRYYGAEIVSFSPLADAQIPERIGALYITGAYLEEYGAELSNNQRMLNSILEFYKNGGIIYSEGAGTAYLCRRFKIKSTKQTHPGVGVLPASAVSTKGQLRYVQSSTVDHSILGGAGQSLRGISTSEWKISEEDNILRALRLSQVGGSPEPEGYSPSAQSLCTLCFNHFGSNPEIAKTLVDSAEVVLGMKAKPEA